jgi:fermentation-respiration switch protein FrsA (DUF1100 family)
MIWLLVVLLVLLLAMLVFGAGFFRFACVRKKPKETDPREAVKHSIYAPYADDLLGGMEFLDAHGTETLSVTSYDGLTLRARLLKQENARGAVLLFHGYRADHRCDFAACAPFYWAQGFSLLLPDERACGMSEGRYITFGVRERRDVYTWVCEAAKRFGKDCPIYLGGLSLGAATVLMASEYDFPANVRGIVADCGYTSPYEIQKSVLHALHPHLPTGLPLFLMNLYTRVFAGFGLKEASAAKAVKKTNYPILFIHGSGDTFVPCRMSQENYDACRSEKRLVIVEGAEHAMSYYKDRPRVQAALEEFLNGHLK